MRFIRSNAMATGAGPVLFGVAFLAPLIAQSLEAASLPSMDAIARAEGNVLAGTDSRRDVIPFPKTASASDLMADCPSPVSEAQLKELQISLEPPKKA